MDGQKMNTASAEPQAGKTPSAAATGRVTALIKLGGTQAGGSGSPCVMACG